jgi:hypothetical protein
MNTDNSLNNNVILLFDSSMDFKSLYPIIKEKKPKIITFDYESHNLFEEKNIEHEVSDKYTTQKDLEYIQEKSYSFAKWFNDPKISHLINYDEINIGECFSSDFHYQLVPCLKKFFEVTKLFEFNKNSTYISSSILYEIISSLTTSVIKLKIKNIDTKKTNNAIKIPINIGKLSFSIKLKHNDLKKVNIFFNKLFQFLSIQKHDKLKSGNTVLFIDFTTKKYQNIFKILNDSVINLVKFDRAIPAIWNLETYSIIKKSNCFIENYSSLINKLMKKSIKSKILKLENDANLLWQQNIFFESFFSLNEKSFWIIIKPLLVEEYTKIIPNIVQEIELTKNLYGKYSFDSILVWSETTLNHLIAIKLAKKQNIPVYVIQHGLYHDNSEMINYNKNFNILPEYADKFLVWGNNLKKHAISLNFDEKNIEVIGSPLHDGIILDETPNILDDSNFILLATSSPYQNIVQDLTVDVMQNYSACIKKICEVTSKLGKKLVIKLHPQPDELDLTDIVKKIDSRIIVVKAGDISPLIKSCEVFISTDISTTMLEAQILKKPVISFPTRNHLGIPKIMDSCLSATIDNFEDMLMQILTDKKFKQKYIERGIEFSENYLLKIGHASKNLLDFLDDNPIINKKLFN